MAEAAAQKQTLLDAVKTYGRQLFGFIRSRVPTDEDAEDILQDVWYQLTNQPEETEIESMSRWLYRVARNKITDSFRKKKNERLEEQGYTDEDGEFTLPEIMIADSTNPETENLKQLFWEALFDALQELPEKQREVFILNELEDFTLQQIADKQKENIKTIISRKGYAVKHLRNRLENLYNEFITY